MSRYGRCTQYDVFDDGAAYRYFDDDEDEEDDVEVGSDGTRERIGEFGVR